MLTIAVVVVVMMKVIVDDVNYRRSNNGFIGK